eukprot:Rhum_TRINITY_DN14938_c8_g1::Rhum_TRINITY_DN14938_c8_g1_i2::g.130196::m.130196
MLRDAPARAVPVHRVAPGHLHHPPHPAAQPEPGQPLRGQGTPRCAERRGERVRVRGDRRGAYGAIVLPLGGPGGVARDGAGQVVSEAEEDGGEAVAAHRAAPVRRRGAVLEGRLGALRHDELPLREPPTQRGRRGPAGWRRRRRRERRRRLCRWHAAARCGSAEAGVHPGIRGPHGVGCAAPAAVAECGAGGRRRSVAGCGCRRACRVGSAGLASAAGAGGVLQAASAGAAGLAGSDAGDACRRRRRCCFAGRGRRHRCCRSAVAQRARCAACASAAAGTHDANVAAVGGHAAVPRGDLRRRARRVRPAVRRGCRERPRAGHRRRRVHRHGRRRRLRRRRRRRRRRCRRQRQRRRQCRRR